MAASPTFAGTIASGAVTVSTANTNRDGTGTIPTVFTAGTLGSLLQRLILHSTGNPADSIVLVFLHDGTNFFLWFEVDLGDPAAGSTTVPAFHFEVDLVNKHLPASWSVRCAITVALTAGVMNAIIDAGNI